MSILNDIDALITVADHHIGYAPTGAQLPYVVGRPLDVASESRSIAGQAIDWNDQFTFYCCAASAEACFNLALMLMGDLDGKRVGGTTLSTSMGYAGAPVEGHYESEVTVQLNQGGI